MPVVPYNDKNSRAEAVERMFDSIARRYDIMNDVMTLGMHRSWKRATAANVLVESGVNALDIACGTGDLTLALLKQDAAGITAIDFSKEMLDVARSRVEKLGLSDRVEFKQADALALPFGDAIFGCAVTGFSLRNVNSIEGTFAEVYRVLKPGGRLASLEITRVKSPLFRFTFELYFKYIVPIIGGIVTGDREAYDYLPASRENVPEAEEVADIMRSVGFVDVSVERKGFGSVAVVSGTRPAAV